MKAPLIGGAYQARSYVASAQACINLYPEANPQDAPFPTTHYLTPGLSTLLALSPATVVRCVYTASNGDLFVACGNKVFFVNSSWVATELGTIGGANTPVSMSDNDTTIIVVDGSSSGWEIDLATHTFSLIVDPNFLGGDIVIFTDTFFVLNEPGTMFFYASDSNTTAFNSLSIAGKVDYQDIISTLMFTNQRFWVFGTQRGTELWYNAGGSPFPFQQVPGVGIEAACLAKYSPNFIKNAVFWLGRDLAGQRIVFRGEGQDVKRISTFAIEQLLQTYDTVSDAIGFTYQLDGHYNYVLTFPAADVTWVWDETVQLWHQWGWSDSNGVLGRARANCHTLAYGKHIVGDHSNGKLYELSSAVFTDAGDPIQWVRSWPHFIVGFDFQKQPIQAEGKRLRYDMFLVEIETGGSVGTTVANPPQISLRWSVDKGKSWLNPVMRSIGATGQYNTRPQWRTIGIGADLVFELSGSGDYLLALNGAYVDSTILNT